MEIDFIKLAPPPTLDCTDLLAESDLLVDLELWWTNDECVFPTLHIGAHKRT